MENNKNTNLAIPKQAQKQKNHTEKNQTFEPALPKQAKQSPADAKPGRQSLPKNLPFAPEEESEKQLAPVAPEDINSDKPNKAFPVSEDSVTERQDEPGKDEPAPPNINTASQAILEPTPLKVDGEIAELPHQPPDIKPDEIVEIEQIEPEKISKKDIEKARELEGHNLPTKIVLPAKKKNDPTPPEDLPSPKTENKLKLHHEKKLQELIRSKEKISANTAAQQKNFSFSGFLKKLAELRKKANAKRREKKQKNLNLIMEYARRKNRITNDDVEKLTGVKDSQATNYLNKLVKDKKLIRFGNKSNIFYKPLN